jgi:putative DNA primase/helicase
MTANMELTVGEEQRGALSSQHPLPEKGAMPSTLDTVGASLAWPVPQNLVTRVEAVSYPLDALPNDLRVVIEEVGAFVKAPISMVSTCAITALAVAIQGIADVRRAAKLEGPSSLFSLIIADSGERKSTVDNFFSKAIRTYENDERERLADSIKENRAAIAVWAARREGLLAAIKAAGKRGESTADLEAKMRDHEKREPARLLVPRLTYSDATSEALAWGLHDTWPAAGLLSSEAGTVFGGHSMGGDSVLRNLALLNQLWGAETVQIDRRTGPSYLLKDVRLTVGLQVQEAAFRSFLEKTGSLARGSGFMARFLICWPKSTQGTRAFKDAPETWPALARYNQRMTDLLQRQRGIVKGVTPSMVDLSNKAKEIWVKFHDAVEVELASSGSLFDVRDVASKIADNAARLAVLFHVFETGSPVGSIMEQHMVGAIRVAAWHLKESQRFFGELAQPQEIADASRLEAWLVSEYRGRRSPPTRRHAQQYGPVRDSKRLVAALSVLADLGRARESSAPKRKVIEVNPALLDGRTP